MDWGSVVTFLVAVLALVGTIFTLLANRRKAQADTRKTDADAAKTITDAAREVVEMHIEAAKAECADLIRKAIIESEERCQKQLAEVKAWADVQIREACEARKKQQKQIDQLRRELGDERDLRHAREKEVDEIVAGLEAS